MKQEQDMHRNTKVLLPLDALFLCLAVGVYSMSGLFTKLAAGYAILSTPYFLCLAGVVTVLGLYAVLWQVALKRVPLSLAYPFRSLGVVYGLAIAGFVFHEEVTVQNLLGGCIVLVGLLLMNTVR